MKLYIWRKDILTNYQDGVAFAMAEDIDQARALLMDKIERECAPWRSDGGQKRYFEEFAAALRHDPIVHESPACDFEEGSD